MGKKLKVLISAYACEPDKGSEPEVGWQWAMQMAQYHDVTILTRTNNRNAIEKTLQALRGSRPLPEFIYHDEGPLLLWFKRYFRAIRLYYIFWQISSWKIIARLHKERPFDLLHHLTFAGFRYRTAIWEHGVPTIWGPVGGIQSIPWRLLPWKYPPSLMLELFRHFNNFVQSAPFHVLPKRAQMTTVTLVSTVEMEQIFTNLGLEVTLMPTIGLYVPPMPSRPVRNPGEPLKILFAGSLITLKGIDLAIQAVKACGLKASFTIVGEGQFGAQARKMVKKLGLESQVFFRGRLTRAETLKVYPNYDVFLFPSLHDTGSYAIIEAMSCGLPVICLDYGGPKLAVREGSGIKVPLGSQRQVIQGLADALRRYDADRKLLEEHGRAAREVIIRDYDWDKKGRQLDDVYQSAVTKSASDSEGKAKVGSFGRIINRLFPIKGLGISAAILFIVGTAGFFSVNYLKKNAEMIVQSTLPELSGAGALNASLAEAFNRTLLTLTTDDPGERMRYREELNSFNLQTTERLKIYGYNITAADNQVLYNQVIKQQAKYAAIQKKTLELMDEGKRGEAMALCKNSLLPAYHEYKSAAEKLLTFNTHNGTNRGEAILRICTGTQYHAVAGIGILLFMIGFVIGFFK